MTTTGLHQALACAALLLIGTLVGSCSGPSDTQGWKDALTAKGYVAQKVQAPGITHFKKELSTRISAAVDLYDGFPSKPDTGVWLEVGCTGNLAELEASQEYATALAEFNSILGGLKSKVLGANYADASYVNGVSHKKAEFKHRGFTVTVMKTPKTGTAASRIDVILGKMQAQLTKPGLPVSKALPCCMQRAVEKHHHS